MVLSLFLLRELLKHFRHRSGAYARYLSILFYSMRSIIYVIELIVLMTLQNGFQLYNDYMRD